MSVKFNRDNMVFYVAVYLVCENHPKGNGDRENVLILVIRGEPERAPNTRGTGSGFIYIYIYILVCMFVG